MYYAGKSQKGDTGIFLIDEIAQCQSQLNLDHVFEKVKMSIENSSRTSIPKIMTSVPLGQLKYSICNNHSSPDTNSNQAEK